MQEWMPQEINNAARESLRRWIDRKNNQERAAAGTSVAEE